MLFRSDETMYREIASNPIFIRNSMNFSDLIFEIANHKSIELDESSSYLDYIHSSDSIDYFYLNDNTRVDYNSKLYNQALKEINRIKDKVYIGVRSYYDTHPMVVIYPQYRVEENNDNTLHRLFIVIRTDNRNKFYSALPMIGYTIGFAVNEFILGNIAASLDYVKNFVKQGIDILDSRSVSIQERVTLVERACIVANKKSKDFEYGYRIAGPIEYRKFINYHKKGNLYLPVPSDEDYTLDTSEWNNYSVVPIEIMFRKRLPGYREPL